jgi:hypothetical protein
VSPDDIWHDDLLKRREDAELLIDFIQRRHAERTAEGVAGAYTINLNAGWGHGKTFFLTRLERHLKSSGHLTAYVNGWRDDATGEPLIAVMAALESALAPHFKKDERVRKGWAGAKAASAQVAVAVAKGAAKQLATRYLGDAVSEVSRIVENRVDAGADDRISALSDSALSALSPEALGQSVESLLTKYLDEKIKDYKTRLEASQEFKSRLRGLLSVLASDESIRLPFVVLIDELDRCRPTYAIEMLEQIKHLFDVDNTLFVIATDGEQLSRSIRAIYGESFDGKAYLRRFFNRHYKFERRDLAEFVRYLFEVNKIDRSKVACPYDISAEALFVGAMQFYDITLRDAEQCFDILRSVVTLWDQPVPVELTIMLPIIVNYQRHNLAAIDEFVRPRATVTTADTNNAHPWEFSVRVQDEYGRSVTTERVDIEKLNRQFLMQARKPLHDNLKNPPSGGAASYIHHSLAREFQVLHRNTHSGNGPTSIVLTYPALVQRVARLAASSPLSSQQ